MRTSTCAGIAALPRAARTLFNLAGAGISTTGTEASARSLSIVTSSDRKKVEERLVTEMNTLDKRLAQVQASAPKK